MGPRLKDPEAFSKYQWERSAIQMLELLEDAEFEDIAEVEETEDEAESSEY